MSLAFKLRIAGWFLFLGGGSLMIFVGQLDMKHPGTIVGVFTACAGFFCTSLCNIIAAREILKRKHAPVEPLTAESAERAKEFIRKRGGNPGPQPQSSPPSEPSKPD